MPKWFVFTRNTNTILLNMYKYFNEEVHLRANNIKQNHTHVKKAFIDELEKQIIIKKLLMWANKKQNNFNIYNVAY